MKDEEGKVEEIDEEERGLVEDLYEMTTQLKE
jgi:hypothetical protein